MPCAFAEVFVVSMPTAFEGVFPLLFLIYYIHANNILGIIQTFGGAGKRGKLFSPVDKDHGGLTEKS